MLLLGLDTFTERYLKISAMRFCNLCYRGSQKSPKHVLNFRSLKFKENVHISLLPVGFYICLWHNRVGGPEINAQIRPGPPSTPPLPDGYVPAASDSFSALLFLVNLLWQV